MSHSDCYVNNFKHSHLTEPVPYALEHLKLLLNDDAANPTTIFEYNLS